MAGSLCVVGAGIKFYKQITIEALEEISSADKVFYLVADQVCATWLSSVSAGAESLHRYYGLGKNRKLSYLEMVERILEEVKIGRRVCFVSYGHPGVFGYPMHEAVRRATKDGFQARMLPGISSEDCLFADIGIDPGEYGCQTFEATDFLLFDRIFDPSSILILLQIGLIGYVDLQHFIPAPGLRVLTERLLTVYPCEHELFLYIASNHEIISHDIVKATLSELHATDVTPLTTMYIPPLCRRKVNHHVINELKIIF